MNEWNLVEKDDIAVLAVYWKKLPYKIPKNSVDVCICDIVLGNKLYSIYINSDGSIELLEELDRQYKINLELRDSPITIRLKKSDIATKDGVEK